MTDLERLFSTDGFMPHGMCYLWRPEILAIHVGADSLIALAYFTIPFTLLYFVRKRAELRFTWIFSSFAIFIVACGVSHVMEIWTIWFPVYWLSGGVKVITALASVLTAILLVKLVPAALRFPTPSALKAANDDLAREIVERKGAEQRVIELNASLEARVAERTQQLAAANQTLLTINARFAVASGAAELAFWDFDVGSRTLRWDDQMFNLYGRPRMQGVQPYDLWSSSLHPEDRAATEQSLQDALAGRARFVTEYRIVWPGGETRHIRGSAAVIRDANGLGMTMHGVNLDITERKRADEKLQALNAELEQRVRARTSELRERDSLIQEIHHRVKNNLQVISSLINMQIRGLEGESSRAALRDCQARVVTMAQIHEMLYQSADYAQVPFGKYAQELTTRILRASGDSAGNVTLDFDLQDVSLPVEQAIPCGLILNELVANCLKHAFPNGACGRIRVELRPAPDRSLSLCVSDNGVGIPAELNWENPSSLGLQLVMTLTEQLDGRLEIIRLPGSTFRITFPLGSHT